jgi:Zn finger protein HypA/HybF involved in hydrogenase expression
MKCISVPWEEYEFATENYSGWCPECEDFTHDSAEPDAEGYKCPVCDNPSVVGAENALLLGMIDIEDYPD